MKHTISFSLLILFLFFYGSAYAGARIVVLGSSTAAGYKLMESERWVTKYETILKIADPTVEVINLAVSGYNSYRIMPTGTNIANRPAPDPESNITKALTYEPDAIIINLPTNDVGVGHSIDEQLYNFSIVCQVANANNVPVWITTSQPRNFEDPEKRKQLMEINDRIYATYGDRAIDFWSDIADEEGRIVEKYNNEDGIHLTAEAHTILAKRVVEKNILSGYYDKVNTLRLNSYINVNFGSSSVSGWNTMPSAFAGSVIYSLKDVADAKTGIEIKVKTSFAGINYNGPETTTTSLDMPGNVTKDAFFGNTVLYLDQYIAPTAGFSIERLNKNKSYTLYFFSSRQTEDSDNRETLFIINGKEETTATLDATNNTSNILALEHIVPNAYGAITVTLKPGTNNNNLYRFFYVNAMRIEETPIPTKKQVFCNSFLLHKLNP